MEPVNVIPELANHKVGDRYYGDADGWDVSRALDLFANENGGGCPRGPGSAIERYYAHLEGVMVDYLHRKPAQQAKYNKRFGDGARRRAARQAQS